MASCCLCPKMLLVVVFRRPTDLDARLVRYGGSAAGPSRDLGESG
jgi:hypothetical protein